MANTNQAAGTSTQRPNTAGATHRDPNIWSGDVRSIGFDLTPDKWWVSLILGLLLIAGGIYLVLHVVAASIVTSIFFGAILLVGGIFQVIHALWAPEWRSRLLSIVIGLLFAGAGRAAHAKPAGGFPGADDRLCRTLHCRRRAAALPCPSSLGAHWLAACSVGPYWYRHRRCHHSGLALERIGGTRSAVWDRHDVPRRLVAGARTCIAPEPSGRAGRAALARVMQVTKGLENSRPASATV